MSLGVLVGGLLFLVALTNGILRLRSEPAPGWGLILAVLLLGAVLAGWPLAVAFRDARRARSEG